MSTTTYTSPSIEIPNLADNELFPSMPAPTKKVATCPTCEELGFKKLEIAHSLEACARCANCHIWRTCGQKKHNKSCAGKPPVLEIVVTNQSNKSNKSKNMNDSDLDSDIEERPIGRQLSDPDFVSDCRHYWRDNLAGHCDRGKLCNFAHDTIGKSAREASNSKRRWAEQCKFVGTAAGCKNSILCSFSHDNSGISAKEASGNIECFKCRGAHHIDNCDATCTSCGSDQHIADKCIECFNCNEWGHHIKDCESACGYCNETGHKQPQCKKNAYCNDCKKQGHVKQDHCQNCDAEPTFGGNCPCKEHVVATRRNFVGPNK